MTFKQLYFRMGEFGLYELRDELFVWKTQTCYSFKDKVPDDIPYFFIHETKARMRETKDKILSLIGKKRKELNNEDH